MSSQGSRDRTYSSPPSSHSIGMSYGWGTSIVQTGSVNDITGVWSPLQLDSQGNLNVAVAGGVTISGATISVSAVAITGAPVVSLTGDVPVNIINTAPIPVSGVMVVNVSVVDTGNRSVSVVNPILAVSGITQIGNTSPIPVSGVVQTAAAPIQAISGNVTIVPGTYSPGLSIITGGQMQIPAGAKSASIAIISGAAYINGSGAFPAGLTLSFGGYDGRLSLASAINVGATGSAASPSQLIISWEV